MEGRVTLAEGVLAQAGEVLGSVDAPPADIVDEGCHEIVQHGFGHHAEQAARQILIRELHGLLRLRIFLAVQIIGGVDLSMPDRDRIQPADDVIVIRRALFEDLQLLGQRARGQGVDFEQARFNLLHLQRDRGEDAQHAQSADHGVEQVGVFLRGAGDFRARGQDGRELGDVLANRPHAEIILAVDVGRETASQRGGHRA